VDRILTSLSPTDLFGILSSDAADRFPTSRSSAAIWGAMDVSGITSRLDDRSFVLMVGFVRKPEKIWNFHFQYVKNLKT